MSFGHTWSTTAFTGLPRVTASCVLSSGASPRRSIWTSTRCASLRASASRPAAYRVVPRSSETSSRTS
ncbi:hypothetical protein [Actinocorallia sp. API 0066]|uniref:hypothetical protein n=1 Tax=Actinocorallia sp. API 0066 TaxID=2896846 RepID=UPI0027E2005D|nr:hypothetical protein [Actinocorallia sp. API 0066]